MAPVLSRSACACQIPACDISRDLQGCSQGWNPAGALKWHSWPLWPSSPVRRLCSLPAPQEPKHWTCNQCGCIFWHSPIAGKICFLHEPLFLTPRDVSLASLRRALHVLQVWEMGHECFFICQLLPCLHHPRVASFQWVLCHCSCIVPASKSYPGLF